VGPDSPRLLFAWLSTVRSVRACWPPALDGDAEWVVLDYEGTNYNLAAFDAQVASVEAAGYDQVATGYGLALLHKR
jgi:hypothetical protein